MQARLPPRNVILKYFSYTLRPHFFQKATNLHGSVDSGQMGICDTPWQRLQPPFGLPLLSVFAPYVPISIGAEDSDVDDRVLLQVHFLDFFAIFSSDRPHERKYGVLTSPKAKVRMEMIYE